MVKAVGRLKLVRIWPLIALFVLEIAILAMTGCALLSPTSKPTATTGDVTASEGSRVTNVTFQWVASKAGWAVTPLTLIGWIAATIRVRRRENVADELIKSIEAAGSSANIVKSHIANKGNDWIDRRVATLCKKHGSSS